MGVSYQSVANCTFDEAVDKIYESRQPKPLVDMTIGELIGDMSPAETSGIFGLYFFFTDNEGDKTPIYIGVTQSWDLLNRVVQHMRWSSGAHPHEQHAAMEQSRVSFLFRDGPWIDNDLEKMFISALKPHYNKKHLNDEIGPAFKKSGRKISEFWDWKKRRNT